MEEKIFSRRMFDEQAMIRYGFVKEGDCYVYKTDFMEGDFSAVITVDTNNTVTGKVIDKMNDEEYAQLRNPNYNGAFVGAVRASYEELLSDIADKCCKDPSYREPVSWIVPANPKYYDIANAFNDTDTIIWKQSSDIRTGDTVYMYVAAPYSAVLYKCVATEVNMPYEFRSSELTVTRVMRVKLIDRYEPGKYTFSFLNKLGIRAVRGPRKISKEICEQLR